MSEGYRLTGRAEPRRRIEEMHRRAEALGRDAPRVVYGESGPEPEMPRIVVEVLLELRGGQYGHVIPVTLEEARRVMTEMHRRRGPSGLDEDYLKRWIGEKVHQVLGDLGPEGSAGIFSGFEMRTDEVGDGYVVEGFVPRSVFDDTPIVPSGSAAFDAVRYAASRLVHAASRGKIGATDEVDYWRGQRQYELDRRVKAEKELRELKERPENRTVEELAQALEQADERDRFYEREIERNEERYEELLRSNVWLSERLAQVDPLYREEVERRRKGGS